MGGGSATQAPAPPVFNPINISQTAQDATNADIAGYNFADADFLSRFPGLVAGRSSDINQVFQNLNGPLDPTLQNQFASKGLSGALGSFGGGNQFASINPGSGSTSGSSIGANSAAKSIAKDTMGWQDLNRSDFQNLLSQNQQRAFGLSGSDIANLNIANTTGLSASNQAAYAGQINNFNAQNAQSNANTQGAIGIGTAILSAAIIAL